MRMPTGGVMTTRATPADSGRRAAVMVSPYRRYPLALGFGSPWHSWPILCSVGFIAAGRTWGYYGGGLAAAGRSYRRGAAHDAVAGTSIRGSPQAPCPRAGCHRVAD